MHTGQSTYFNDPIYFSSPNPFIYGFIGQCTWYCWSKANSKAKAYPERHLRCKDLPTKGASKWADIAESRGYTVEDTPQNDCIACWKGGHVAYVETYDPDTQEVCFSEANWYKGTNPSAEIIVPSNVKDVIARYVSEITRSVKVKDRTVNNQRGTDGLFKTLELSKFKSRTKGTCRFIYLN